jgi:hypothetical protein
MKLLFGIVLGAVLTVGAAYYHDTSFAAPTATATARPIVNWDVAGSVANSATRMVRTEFNRLIGSKP